MTLQILTIPCLSDNYAYLAHDPATGKTAAIDVPEAGPLLHALKEHGWTLEFGEIAKIWRAGCIIRAVFLQSISQAYENNEDLANLLMDPFFAEQITQYQSDWRESIAQATLAGVPCPAMMSALSYYDSYRTAVLPANLLQGQRDYFGAHTYQRVDKPAGKKYHIEWSDPSRPQTAIKK